MNLSETIKSLGRRWYIVLLGFALTLGTGMLIGTKVPTTYEASGSILLMPPESTVGVQGNPYLWLGGLNTALDVLVRRTSAIEVSGPLLNKYQDSGLTIIPDRTTSSAIALVTAEAPSPETALQLRDDAMAAIIKTLGVMQDESQVKNDQRIYGDELVIDKSATPKTKTRLQLLIIVGGGGTFGTLLLAGAIDGWIMDRRLQKKAAMPHTEPAPLRTNQPHAAPSGDHPKTGSAVPASHQGPATDSESTADPLTVP